jgi:hypothetical protein
MSARSLGRENEVPLRNLVRTESLLQGTFLIFCNVITILLPNTPLVSSIFFTQLIGVSNSTRKGPLLYLETPLLLSHRVSPI